MNTLSTLVEVIMRLALLNGIKYKVIVQASLVPCIARGYFETLRKK
jgi:hypothetical protein